MASTSQTTSPFGNVGGSRLTVTIIGLIALAFLLSAVYIYLQLGQGAESSAVLTQEQKDQYISAMQEKIQSQKPLPASQKSALLSAMAQKLQTK